MNSPRASFYDGLNLSGSPNVELAPPRPTTPETQVRFSVTLETMVVEKELTADNRNHFMSLAKDRSSPPRGVKREVGDQNGRDRGTGVAR